MKETTVQDTPKVTPKPRDPRALSADKRRSTLIKNNEIEVLFGSLDARITRRPSRAPSYLRYSSSSDDISLSMQSIFSRPL
jgi:hypothetical protein